MADIFLSYTEKDRDTVRRLAETLQDFGWTVWWDRRIPAGSTWRSVLNHELGAMRCMVVLWSSHSVQSEWVCEEADEGRRLNCLVPVLIDRVRPPAGFREIQAADLVGWDGRRDFLGLQRLVEDIERLIGKGAAARTASQPPSDSRDAPAIDGAPEAAPTGGGSPPGAAPMTAGASVRRWLPWGVATMGVLVVIAAYLVGGAKVEDAPSLAHLPALGDSAAAGSEASLPAASSAPAPQSSSGVSAPPGATAANDATPPVVVVRPSAPEARTAVARQRPGPAGPLSAELKARCDALTERLSLGEGLSSEAKQFLTQECHP